MKVPEKYLSYYYETAGEIPEPKIDLKTTAFLNIDMQNEFCRTDMGEAKEFKEAGEWDRWEGYFKRLNEVCIPNAKRILDFFRANNMICTYGCIACLREDGEDRSPVQKSEGWNGMLLPYKSYGAQVVDELAPQGDDIVVYKTTDSVLNGTNYEKLLRFMGIKTVVVTGMVTDQCVASTVRDLADYGYQVIVVDDATNAATMELHEAELKIMNIIYCTVLSTDETLALLEKAKG